jgi:hypothetical protein
VQKVLGHYSEAIDRTQEVFPRRLGLYDYFASADHIDPAMLAFLKKHQLDEDTNGYALARQISHGNIDNVRMLLELGADPNERHGIQHAALDAVQLSLRDQGDKAIAIARLLLEYGADPTMLIHFDYQDKDAADKVIPPSPLQPQLDDLFGEAARRIAAADPVDVDFVDFEWNLPPSSRPSYARFYVFNRTKKPLTLDMYRDDEGFDYSGEKTVFECVIPPGTVWDTCDSVVDFKPAANWKRISLGGREMSLLRVPINVYPLLDGPPTLRVRVRIPSTGGIDFVSEPFSLHDSRYVRGYWPQKGRKGPVNQVPGEKLLLGAGVKAPVAKDYENAPHSHPTDEQKTSEANLGSK